MIPTKDEILKKHRQVIVVDEDQFPHITIPISDTKQTMDEYAKEILKAALSNHVEVSLGIIVDDNGTYSDIDEYFEQLKNKKGDETK